VRVVIVSDEEADGDRASDDELFRDGDGSEDDDESGGSDRMEWEEAAAIMERVEKHIIE
jgi:hypothetical protein